MLAKPSLTVIGLVIVSTLAGCGGLFFSTSNGSGGGDDTPPPMPDTYQMVATADFTDSSGFTGDLSSLTATVGKMSTNGTHRIFEFGPVDSRRVAIAIPDVTYVSGAWYPVQAAAGLTPSELGGIVGVRYPDPLVFEAVEGAVEVDSATSGMQLIYQGLASALSSSTPQSYRLAIEMDLPNLTALPEDENANGGTIYSNAIGASPALFTSISAVRPTSFTGYQGLEAEFPNGDKFAIAIPGTLRNGVFPIGNGTDPSTAIAQYSEQSTSTGYASLTSGYVYVSIVNSQIKMTFHNLWFPASAMEGFNNGWIFIDNS